MGVSFSRLSTVAALWALAGCGSRAPELAAPATLRETGLYADGDSIAPGVLPFTPQYPLWSDGASKRRWIRLPAPIDGRDPDEWEFPVGTRIWKEFSFGGSRTETRYMVRSLEGWQYATYVWSADGREAVRAPDGGAAGPEIAPGVRHAIPSLADCRACHGNGASPVLGFSALQLSPDRDPGAAHAEAIAPGSPDLAGLVERGLIQGLPGSLLTSPPRIPGPPLERSALGYLHANCGGCHRGEGPAGPLGMVLVQPVAAGVAPGVRTTVGRESRFRAPALRIAPGDPEHSVLLARMGSRTPVMQMPPLGTQLVDREGLDLITRWIHQLEARGENR